MGVIKMKVSVDWHLSALQVLGVPHFQKGNRKTTEYNAFSIMHLQSKKCIHLSTSVFVIHLFAVFSSLHLNLHNEWCIMTTGNCGVCGQLRDASCFREEYINRN